MSDASQSISQLCKPLTTLRKAVLHGLGKECSTLLGRVLLPPLNDSDLNLPPKPLQAIRLVHECYMQAR